MACGINLRHKSLAEIAFNTEAQARLQARGTSLAELGLSSESLAQVQMRSSSLASIQMALGCPAFAAAEDEYMYNTVTDWYVDPVNGSDTADGLTPATAFASYFALNQQIGSPLTVLAQNTTVHVLNDVPDNALPFSFFGIIVTPFILRVRQENPTVLGTFTLGAVQNIAINSTYPTIQLNPAVDFITAGTGGTSLVGHRFRKVSGPGPANVGTLFWLEEATSGDPTIGYVNRPQFADPPLFATNEALTTGDVYVVEELGVLGKLEINPRDNQVINFATQTVSASVENGRGVIAGTVDKTSVLGAADGTAGVCVHGCHLNYGRVYANFTNIQACRLGGFSATDNIYCRRLVYLTGCSVQGGLTFGGNGECQFYNNVSFSGRGLSTEQSFGVSTYLFWDAVSFRNWPGAAFSANAAQGQLRGLLWGTSTVAGSYGIDMSARGRFTFNNAPTVSGAAAHDYDIGGLQDTYSAGPLPVINPANNAMLVAHT